MISGLYGVLSPAEIEQIHRSALQVLHRVGVRVESKDMLDILDRAGAQVNLADQRARFAPATVESFISASDRYDWGQHRPRFNSFVGIYQSRYLSPDTDCLEEFCETTLRDYVRLGQSLGAGGFELLGLPFVPEGIPPAYIPLADKIYAWRYGIGASGTVRFAGLCPYLIEIYARYAQEVGRPLAEVWSAYGHLISPLRLARGECEQLLYFRSRGLRMHIGHMLSLGASTPVTIAGAAVLKLAEAIFLSILHRALWGGSSLRIGGFGVVMDMRGLRSMGGRPEIGAISAVLGQVARFYGVRSGGGGGLTDAKRPSVQAGMQKAMNAVAAVHSCGGGGLNAGLLSLDEVCSPEQMVYDMELVSAVRHMLRPVEVSDETCAVEDIVSVGPGGNFVGSDLTANRFRAELWEPAVWDRESLQEWLARGGSDERRRVKDRIREVLASPAPESRLSDDCERDVRAIIARAVAADAATS
jgi:trimethylamine--corrinoid protein Co-methyltransferase